MTRSIVAWLAVLLLAAASHAAEPYPSRAIRVVVGFPPGGGADGIARLLADHMSRTLKQPVVVENRPGADSTIAPSVVASAPADGYTLLLAPDAIYGADKALYPATVKYDESSFTPINRVASTFFVLAANKDAGIRRWADLAAKGRQSQPPLFLASPGGSYLQIIAADLKRLSGLNLEEVPYKGGAPATVAVIAGEAWTGAPARNDPSPSTTTCSPPLSPSVMMAFGPVSPPSFTRRTTALPPSTMKT